MPSLVNEAYRVQPTCQPRVLLLSQAKCGGTRNTSGEGAAVSHRPVTRPPLGTYLDCLHKLNRRKRGGYHFSSDKAGLSAERLILIHTSFFAAGY